MAKAKQALIGIDLLDAEVRLVEVRYKANQPQVVNIATAPLADGVVHRGAILLPAALAVTLRTLIDSIGSSGSSRAAFGVSIDRCALRTFELPPAKSDELPLMVAGEVAHHGLHSEDGGAHGFFELNPPLNPNEVHPVNVAVVAIEGNLITQLQEVANRAGLTIAGLEPLSFAMYRAGLMASSDTSPCFTLVIGESGSEISYTADGRIKAYRRLDAGTRAILGDHSRAAAQPINTEYDANYLTPPTVRDDAIIGPEVLLEGGVSALCTELRRTLNFFERQLPESKDVERLVLLVDEPDLTALTPRLQEELGLRLELARPSLDLAENDLVRQQLEASDSVHYLGALGLALHYASSPNFSTPRLDLYSEERREAQWINSAKNLWGSVIVSVIALALTIVGYVLFGAQISSVNQHTKAAQAREKKIKADTDAYATQANKQLKQYMTLRREGAPLGSLADAISSALEPGVGITSIGIGPDLKLTIQGEAIDENAMLVTLRKLQANQLIQGLAISSYTRSKDSNGVSFQLTAQTLTMDHVHLAGEPVKGNAPPAGTAAQGGAPGISQPTSPPGTPTTTPPSSVGSSTAPTAQVPPAQIPSSGPAPKVNQ